MNIDRDYSSSVHLTPLPPLGTIQSAHETSLFNETVPSLKAIVEKLAIKCEEYDSNSRYAFFPTE